MQGIAFRKCDQRFFFIGASCSAALLAVTLPVGAESANDIAVLHTAVGNLQQNEPYVKLSGAVAACLSGQGDMNLTTGWFEES